MFSQVFDVPPIPPRRERVGVQVAEYAQLIADTGSIDAAVDAVVAGLSADSVEPSEAARLHRLYLAAYSEQELKGMALATFRQLGLVSGEGS